MALFQEMRDVRSDAFRSRYLVFVNMKAILCAYNACSFRVVCVKSLVNNLYSTGQHAMIWMFSWAEKQVLHKHILSVYISRSLELYDVNVPVPAIWGSALATT